MVKEGYNSDMYYAEGSQNNVIVALRRLHMKNTPNAILGYVRTNLRRL